MMMMMMVMVMMMMTMIFAGHLSRDCKNKFTFEIYCSAIC